LAVLRLTFGRKEDCSQLCRLNVLRYFLNLFINLFIIVPFINIGCLKLKLKRKAIDDGAEGAEPPAKKRTLAQRDDMPLHKVRISSNVFFSDF